MKKPNIQRILKKLAAVVMTVAVMGAGVTIPKADTIQALETEQQEAQAVNPGPSVAEPATAAIGKNELPIVSNYEASTPSSGSVKPMTGVLIYGSTYCTSGGGVGRLNQWYARMSGSNALAYTSGGCSFGYNSSKTNIMGTRLFVSASYQLTDFEEQKGPFFADYDKTRTVLYY